MCAVDACRVQLLLVARACCHLTKNLYGHVDKWTMERFSCFAITLRNAVLLLLATVVLLEPRTSLDVRSLLLAPTMEATYFSL